MAFCVTGRKASVSRGVGSILSKLLMIFRRPAGISHPRNNVLSLFFCVRQYLCSDLLAECVSVWWHVRQTINGGERIPASFWSRLRSHTSSWSISPFFSTASVCPISSSVFSSFSLTSPSLGPRGGHRWPAMAVGSPSGRPPHRVDRPRDRPHVEKNGGTDAFAFGGSEFHGDLLFLAPPRNYRIKGGVRASTVFYTTSSS